MGSKTLILCAVLMCVIAVNCYREDYQVPADATEDQEWEYYKTFFKKTYDTPEENAQRKANYFKTKAQIAAHNKKFDAGEVTYKQGINHLSDLTEDEFNKQYLTGIKMPENERKKRAAFTVPEGTSIDDEWTAYKTFFKKTYDDTEDAQRKAIYIEHKKEIEEHNKLYAAGEVTYSKGINQFTDLDKEEFKKKHLHGIKLPAQE